MSEMILHCYDNGHDTVIAESLEEAKSKWDEWTGTDRDYLMDDDDWEEIHDIDQIPDDRILNLFVEDELEHKPDGVEIDGSHWKATAGAWARSQGKGFFCSEDY